MNLRDLEQTETLDVGFFVTPVDSAVQHPGRIAKDSDGRLHGVMFGRTTGDRFTKVSVAGRQEGSLWVFSGEKGQYVLMGVRGGPFGQHSTRFDLCGGGHEFLRWQIIRADAVFQVTNPSATGEGGPVRALTQDLMFDVLGVASAELGPWVGLELPKDDQGLPPQRSARRKHRPYEGGVGRLLIESEGYGDIYGDEWHHKDVVMVECSERRSLESMYDIAHVVHDFINITIGEVVSATLALYDTGGCTDHRAWRRFDLLAQGNRFASCEPVNKRWGVMLELDEAGGLGALAALLTWCDQGLNATILHRVACQWGDWRDAFTEHWRTLNMIVPGRRTEKARIRGLVVAVGWDVVTKICPGDVGFEDWTESIAEFRNNFVAHPSKLDDSRELHEGPIFARQLDFLLRAFVLKNGLGVRLDASTIRRLKRTVNDWGDWDWRRGGGSHPVY